MCQLNLNKSVFYILVSALLLSSCATTQKGKIFEAMLIGSTVGAIYGAGKPEFKEQNAMMYGAVAGLATAATVVALDDTDKKLKDFEAKVKFLDDAVNSQQKPTSTASLLLELPEEFRPLVESQTFESYHINRWTRKGEKYLIKESDVIEFTGKR